MSFFSWLGWDGSQSLKVPGKRKPLCRLRVEQLEDRAVPASYSAATVPELIDAMNAANLTPEADTIVLVPQTTFTLTAVNNSTHGATGLPVIAAGEDLTILGNGSVIERSTASGTPAFRLFDVLAGGALTLQNLTLQGGLSSAGGAIASYGSLTLQGVTIQNNQAIGYRGSDAFHYTSHSGIIAYPGGPGGSAHGGGLFIGGGTALLNDVVLSSNLAQGGKGGDGETVTLGGGARRESGYGGSFKNPSGDGGDGLGGGLYVAAGTVTLRNTTVTGNTAKGGAAGQGVGGVAGQGIGGGLYIETDALAFLDAFTAANVKRNKASTSDPNIHGTYTIG